MISPLLPWTSGSDCQLTHLQVQYLPRQHRDGRGEARACRHGRHRPLQIVLRKPCSPAPRSAASALPWWPMQCTTTADALRQILFAGSPACLARPVCRLSVKALSLKGNVGPGFCLNTKASAMSFHEWGRVHQYWGYRPMCGEKGVPAIQGAPADVPQLSWTAMVKSQHRLERTVYQQNDRGHD